MKRWWRCRSAFSAAMAAALVAREEVDGTVVRTTNLVQAGVVDLVRRPWWWSFSSPLVLLNSWWSWLVDARVRCCHGEDGEAWWLRRDGAGSRRWWCVVRRSLRDSDLFLAAGGARRMVECSRCCCRCGGEKMVLRELAVVGNDGALLWLCARRWNCGGVAAATDGGAGTRGEDYMKVLPWWFNSVFRRGQVRKMVAQGADSWWWRERWRRRCCANGGRWWSEKASMVADGDGGGGCRGGW